jgi:hypothetical protein
LIILKALIAIIPSAAAGSGSVLALSLLAEKGDISRKANKTAIPMALPVTILVVSAMILSSKADAFVVEENNVWKGKSGENSYPRVLPRTTAGFNGTQTTPQ